MLGLRSPLIAQAAVTEDRIVQLETRLAYQEASIETLSAEVARQARVVEQLQLRLKQVIERLPPPADGGTRGSAEEEMPPHY